jgi:phosphatidylserine decarboxylase
MRIPLTKYGLPQVVIFPACLLICMIILPFIAPVPAQVLIITEILLAIILAWVFSFFRDPARTPPADSNLLLSPADGKVADIQIVDCSELTQTQVLRIGIFLSVFNVHINRSPCPARVEKITYKQGKFKDARDPEAGKVNESNDLQLLRLDEPKDRLLVRQISGAIARRIVCAAKPGQELSGGEKFGMIKFGSRTELYLPVRQNAVCLVKPGDMVKAGLSPLVRYENV